eukprot:gene11136-3955_t
MEEKTSSGIQKKLRPMIDLIDDLRQNGVSHFIALPSIVVVGDQSSGKSSVIESLSGLELPRGIGCVTRCPIIIQMVRSYDKKNEIIFNEQLLNSSSELPDKILELQEKITGNKKGISDSPINIKVFSPDVYDLTLIDLPGITRVPVDDQPKDIYEQITTMIASYIQDPRSIILTVVPATVDISTTEAIKIAHEYDKKGVRTVGVLTKVDLMDRGTDASQVLKNKSQVKLDLGIIAVKNRSKEDIDNKKTLNESKETEKNFFENHPIYKKMTSLCGTENLAELLSKILKTRIDDELPSIKKEIDDRLLTIKTKLTELGEGVPKSEIEQQKLIFRIVEQFCTQLRLFIDGEEKILNDKFEGNPSNELHQLLFEYGQTIIKSSPDYFSDSYRKEIRIELDKSRGRELSGFLPFRVFTRIIHRQLEELEEPSLELLDDVSLFIETLMNKIADVMILKFPLVKSEMKSIFNQLIEEKKKLTNQMVKDEIIKEKFIFTNNHYYMDTLNKKISESVLGTSFVDNFDDFTKEIQNKISQKLSVDNHEQEVTDMICRLRAYYKVVMKRLMDRVPQTIHYYLVNGIYQDIQWKLQPLMNLEKCSELLKENNFVEELRDKLTEEKATLDKAKLIIKKLSYF